MDLEKDNFEEENELSGLEEDDELPGDADVVETEEEELSIGDEEPEEAPAPAAKPATRSAPKPAPKARAKPAAKKAVGPARELRVEIDQKNGDIKAFAKLIVSEKVISQPKKSVGMSVSC